MTYIDYFVELQRTLADKHYSNDLKAGMVLAIIQGKKPWHYSFHYVNEVVVGFSYGS